MRRWVTTGPSFGVGHSAWVALVPVPPLRERWSWGAFGIANSSFLSDWLVVVFPHRPKLTEPRCDRPSDLHRRVLLEEVHPTDGHLTLRRPGSAEAPEGSGQRGPRLTVDEQFRKVALAQPL